MKRRRIRRLLAVVGAVLLFASQPLVSLAHAQTVAVGMNIVNPQRARLADQNALIAQLKAAHVTVVRCGITADDQGIDFAKRLHAQGIKIDLILNLQYAPGAPTRPYQAEAFPAMWGGHPLSSADPQLSRTYFQSLLGKLDANGIVLAGLELGNEINWAAFNPEFPLPGEGRNFSLEDLHHDPEAQRIAKGYLQYLKVLAVLKDVRDHSKINQHTPLLSAGLADGGPEGPRPGAKADGVSIGATLQFLRANGLDLLVDAYGIHTYPWDTTHQGRLARLEKYAVSECRPAGSAVGKPCWITEWGISNKELSCPLNDAGRAAIVQDMMGDFRQLAAQRRLTGLLYFSWDSDPSAKQVAASSVYRCGALTEAGKSALDPM